MIEMGSGVITEFEMTPDPIERASKMLALLSALIIVALQIAVDPDGTATIRALAALALIGGWLVAQSSQQTIHACWLLLAPLAPAVLRLTTGREGPILDLIWMAGLTGSLLRSVSWSRWSFPPGWRVLIGGWALTLTLVWPVIVAREVSFDLRLFHDMGSINSWAMLAAPQVVAWTLHVALTQLLGLIWFDWIADRIASQPDRMPRAVHALWIGAALASLVAIWQGAHDYAFLSTPAWASLRRATGTLLDGNAYGVTAAIAGPIAFLVIRRRAVGAAVLLVTFAGMWLSGSRTALLCATGGVLGLGIGTWAMRARAPRWLLGGSALAAIAIVVVVTVSGRAAGPLGRLMERPAESTGMLDSLLNRGGYGTIAVRMIARYPLTGVGLGAYHVIAPDYWRVMRDKQLPFDNAQNWWRHVAAEFGLLGAAAVVLWSGIIAWVVVTGRARPDRRAAAWTVRGLLAGLGACSLLGIPTQTPVVLLSFFLLVAWLAVLVERPDLPIVASRPHAAWIAVAVLAAACAAGDLVLARGPLSVTARAVAAHREFSIGAYPTEGALGEQYRWTSRNARFMWPARTRWMVLRLWASHPDLARNPVRITVSGKCGVLLDRTVADSSPVELGIEVPPGQEMVQVDVHVSRGWRPSQFGERDTRELGVAVVDDFVSDPEQIHRLNGPAIELAGCTAAG
jgi:hypothetical protein